MSDYIEALRRGERKAIPGRSGRHRFVQKTSVVAKAAEISHRQSLAAVKVTKRIKLKDGTPKSRDNAPYTMGAKRTRSKMSWQGKDCALFRLDKDDTGNGVAYVPDKLAFESRGYLSRKDPWRFRVWGNTLYFENDRTCRSRPILQLCERMIDDAPVINLEWLIDIGEEYRIYEFAMAFLGLDLSNPASFSAVAAERRALFDVASFVTRDRQRKLAKKLRNAKRPTKRERQAKRLAVNDAGQPKKTFKLY